MKYMEQFNVLNISLILIILLMGGYEYYKFKEKDNLKISTNKKMRLDTEEVKLDDAKKLLARGDYMVVTEKNLFHPDRKPVKQQAEFPVPEFLVYGTITGAINTAFIEDKKTPYTTPGRGQRQRLVHEGDSLSGYTVNAITPEYVEFTKDGSKLIVKVFDFVKKKVRQSGESTKTAAATPQPPGHPLMPMPPVSNPQTAHMPSPPQAAQLPSPPALPMPPPAAPQNPGAKQSTAMMPPPAIGR